MNLFGKFSLWPFNYVVDIKYVYVFRSHIRGQNIPLDPNVVAERADRRRKAMELQAAIKEQLLEQEQMKKWEKEKQMREEQLAEEKLRRQLEAERERLDQEKRMQEEKIENEKRKAELMRLAIEKAELEAKLEREKRKKHVKPNLQEQAVDERANIPMEKPRPESAHVVTPVQSSVGVNSYGNSPAPQSGHDSVSSKSADIDGIALVLQSISPMVPLAKLAQAPPDLLGLNNSVNNLQFALLLAQQQQQLNMQARQLNSISSTSSILSSSDGTSPNTVREGIPETNPVIVPVKPHNEEVKAAASENEKECIYCCRIHGGSRDKTKMDTPIVQEPDKKIISDTAVETTDKSNETIEGQPLKADENNFEESLALDVPKIPTDGTFIKQDLVTVDTEMSTQTDGVLSGNDLATQTQPRILTPRKYRVTSAVSKALISTSEIGVQTDLMLQCNICTNKQLFVKEISQVTTSVTQTSKRDLSPIQRSHQTSDHHGRDDISTTTVTTTTTIRAKAKNMRKEPRPKWGVNQPTFQYVKASDRDPFCLKYRRSKKNSQLKNSFSIDEDTLDGYRKKADSGISSKNGSLHSIDLNEETNKSMALSRRNMCTEILPISTDGNGQVFVNFREARMVQQLESTENGSSRTNQGSFVSLREKIMEKRSEDLPVMPKST